MIPSGSALILNTIRRASEIRPLDELKLPAQGKAAAGLKAAELKMAAQLIGDMKGRHWNSEAYIDRFTDAVRELVNQKVEAGETERVTPLEDALMVGGFVASRQAQRRLLVVPGEQCVVGRLGPACQRTGARRIGSSAWRR